MCRPHSRLVGIVEVFAHLGTANTDLTAVKRTGLAALSTRHAKDVIFSLYYC